ncbi:GNAT family N-acetyltransferase [Mycolicibacterium lutetiense]|uniref:GNAT family acetyltransferase n=1 Tax=Mycolicibacterium lutetiense TaxID=1641992 RepID=A0ABS4ZZG8_9MYCO|nr:GNAT family N-acetyltransferase [Mycolicibacterium lutetiense]MBP2454890.1 putative GNAT family acetyltransferase [Mycolicibacterium lutetiense]
MAEVRNIPEARHYEITVDGEHAGLAAYIDSGDQRIFHHTEIDEKFGGRGLAGELVSAALADARAAGKRIVAVCPFVVKYVKTHHDFDDILDPATPQVLAVVEANAG